MPVDNKRISGPENSVPYSIYLTSNDNICSNKLKNLFKDNGTRIDGRTSNEHRKIYLKTDVICQAKGSAYIEMNNTKVIVSVFDPREIPNKNEYSLNGELFCEFKYAPFSCLKRRLHQQDSEEKEYSVILRRALESAVCRHEFPNFQVDIYALVLENDGSALSAAITCAGVALIQAGIPMYDIITSVTLGRQGKDLFIDPNFNEESICNAALETKKHTYENLRLETGEEKMIVDDECKENEILNSSDHGTVLLSLLSAHQQISEIYQTGSISLDVLTESIDLLIKINNEVFPLVQKCIVKYVQKSLKEKKEIYCE